MTANEGRWLAGLILATIAIRLLAWLALDPQLGSDAAAYFTMAEAMAHGVAPVDQFGQHAFYSVGYPLALTPLFAIFGASVTGAIAANLVLAAISSYLVFQIARLVGLPAIWRLVAIAGHAVWLPGIWNSAQLARENLSTPLLLVVVWLSLTLLDGKRTAIKCLLTGLAMGSAVLAGGSALSLVAVPLVALWFVYREALKNALPSFLAYAAGCILIAAPWAITTHHMVGEPVLNTNGGFNLYLGNNPAATGHFVSIADTPAGGEWEAMRRIKGEVGASKQLGDRATEYMLQNPSNTAALTVKKLGLFWAPNWPDAADTNGSTAMTAMRIGEVVQYLLFFSFAAVGVFSRTWPLRTKFVLGTAVVLFWMIHGIAYNIMRYRDPIMPIIIVLAVIGLQAVVSSYRNQTPGGFGAAQAN